ncbi:MAG: ABC transporter permease subunit [Candidatus Bathyarchaeia archaeon]
MAARKIKDDGGKEEMKLLCPFFASMRGIIKQKNEVLFLIPLMLFICLFILYPLTQVFVRSFQENTPIGKFTFRNYVDALTQARYLNSLKNTMWFAGVSTLVGAVGGTFVGVLAARMSSKARSVLLSLYSLPMTLSAMVVAFAFITLLGRRGVFNIILKKYFGVTFDLYSWEGLIFVYAFYNIPLMTLTMAGIFLNLDKALVEAARSLGAKWWQTWIYVIIPVLAPGFLAGTSIVFAGMLSAFATVLALTGMAKPLLSLQIYSHASESYYNLPQASALTVLLILVIVVTLVILTWVERKLRPGS